MNMNYTVLKSKGHVSELQAGKAAELQEDQTDWQADELKFQVDQAAVQANQAGVQADQAGLPRTRDQPCGQSGTAEKKKKCSAKSLPRNRQ